MGIQLWDAAHGSRRRTAVPGPVVNRSPPRRLIEPACPEPRRLIELVQSLVNSSRHFKLFWPAAR